MNNILVHFVIMFLSGIAFMVSMVTLMAALKLLPKSIRNKIENYHNE